MKAFSAWIAALAGAALLVGSARAHPSQDSASVVAGPPFSRTDAGTDRDAVTLAWTADAYAELAEHHARGALVELELTLPDGPAAQARLWPVRCLDAGARARVVTARGERWSEPRARCFAGATADGGTVFLGVSPEQVHGTLTVGTRLHALTGVGRGNGVVELSRARGGAAAFLCDVRGSAAALDAAPEGGPLLASTPVLSLAEVFVEVEGEVASLFPTTDECLDYVVIVMTDASEVYRRDVGLVLRIPDGYLRLWEKPVPWSSRLDVTSVARWWNSPENALGDLPRAAVHVLNAGFRGQGFVDGTCDRAEGYAKSGQSGTFVHPFAHTSPLNIDLHIVAHEFGHVFGSVHSQDYHPPIVCDDGSGPDAGTLMSYCGIQDGNAHVGTRFHLREQERIRARLLDKPCLKRVALLPGDYDASGTLDRIDLAAADRTLAQGFRSLGAEEALDVDRDGDFDLLDRELLAELVTRRGRTTRR